MGFVTDKSGPETKRTSSGAQRAEEQDPGRWRKQRFEAQGRARDRGTGDDDDQRPRDRGIHVTGGPGSPRGIEWLANG